VASRVTEKHLIRPYGDRKDDGVVQISFVLPVPVSEKAKEAAAQVAKKLIELGYTRVRPLQGGLDAWLAAGHEVELRPPAR